MKTALFTYDWTGSGSFDELNLSLFSLSFMSQEKRRMDSHETNFTGDEDIIVTKTIRSVSGKKLFDQKPPLDKPILIYRFFFLII